MVPMSEPTQLPLPLEGEEKLTPPPAKEGTRIKETMRFTGTKVEKTDSTKESVRPLRE